MTEDTKDSVDIVLTQWAKEWPSLDVSSLAIISRAFRISKKLEKQVSRLLNSLGLEHWEFDVLVTLLRCGPPYELAPNVLSNSSLLSGGAMTNRLDRLEGRGFLRRLPDPNDRRATRVQLSEKGKRIATDAMAARIDSGTESLAGLSKNEQRSLASLLRQLLTSLEESNEQ